MPVEALKKPPRSTTKSEIHTGNIDYSMWRYFLGLENEFVDSLYYVELSTKNNGAFSTSFAKQFVGISSEFESIAKLLCKSISNASVGNIGQIKGELLKHYPDLPSRKVILDEYDFPDVLPFTGWDTGGLDWWDSYTDLKHHRISYFDYGNLKNVLHSLAGLMVIEHIYYRDVLRATIYGTRLIRIDGMSEQQYSTDLT